MLVGVAGENPLKLEAARLSVAEVMPPEYEVVGVPNISTGVPPQPLDWNAMVSGCENRAHGVLVARPDVGIAIGIESGVVRLGRQAATTAAVLVLDNDDSRGYAFARGINLRFLRDNVLEYGLEVADAMQAYREPVGLAEQDRDCVSYLTEGKVSALSFFADAITEALRTYREEAEGYAL